MLLNLLPQPAAFQTSVRPVVNLIPALARHYATQKLFDKILVANRGEIACRVMQTCKRLGIKTVAVYSEADKSAKHVKMADEAYLIGPPPTSESYLRMDKILEVCKQSGVQAVHPGYGFLSENPKFPQALESIGVVFIGPKPSAIEAMGDKLESKKLAKKAGVNTIPGFLGEVDTPEQVVKISNEIGYPVMIKASAGGGGKGMRIAWNDKEAVEGFRLSKEEARSSFGDDRMIIEKFVDQPRHIEIQVLGDSHGNAIYLPERECSIQRRNQKVLEEAPSSYIDRDIWRRMGEQAVSLSKAVGYNSAGTVEMLVDSKKKFYFLEMNTRLQVEHPVTEYITGIDLVEEMIRVAAGNPLSYKQEDIKINGWAMEARVYAEDPFRNFLPSIGALKDYKEPCVGDPNVRVDSGILEGSEISIYYDPMICKLITYGQDRQAAIDKLKTALDSYVIRGVNHNIAFLRAVMENDNYVRGNFTTRFINETYPDGFTGHVLNPEEMQQLYGVAAAAEFVRRETDYSITGNLGPVYRTDNFIVKNAEEEKPVTISRVSEDTLVTTVDNKKVEVQTDWALTDLLFQAKVNNKDIFVQVDKKEKGYILQHCGTKFPIEVRTPRENELYQFMPVIHPLDTTKVLLSPMPGSIISVSVQEGEEVVVGQELCVVEAMKMQNVLRAERDTKVTKVNVKAGDNVAVEEVLVEFE